MNEQTDKLEAWEHRLLLAEEELNEREQQALARDAGPQELLAFAAERERLAVERDEVASSYDEQATGRDRLGFARDVAGSGRDRRARTSQRDMDAGATDRLIAGTDRDLGAGDRGDSHDDRARSGQARERAADDRAHAAEDRGEAMQKAAQQDRELEGLRAALESRLDIGHAQGLLMAQHNLTAERAFAVLVRLSQESNTKLRVVAADLVKAFEAGLDQG